MKHDTNNSSQASPGNSVKENRCDSEPESGLPLTYADMQRLLHELQVHKIQLEMQNAELQAARDDNLAMGTYADLYDFAPVGYLSLDGSGTIRSINFSGAELLGEERSLLIGRSFSSFVAEKERLTFRELIKKSVTNAAKVECDVMLLNNVTTPRSVRIQAKVSPSGEEYRLALIDITEQKTAEEKLRASEAHLNEAQRLTRLGSWERDYTRDSLHWSDEMFRITEVPTSNFNDTFENYMYAVHPDDRSIFLRAAHDAHKAQAPYSLEYRLKMPDRRIKWVHSRGTATYDEHGQPLIMTGTTQDITERKLADEALQRSEGLLRLIIDSVPARVSYVDSAGRFRLVNRQYEEMLRPGETTFCGRHLKDMLSTSAWAVARPFMERVLAGEQVFFENKMCDTAGKEQFYSVIYTPDRDVNGVVHGFVTLVLDITEQKQCELALRSYSRRMVELEEEVRKKLAAELHDEMGPDLTALNFDLALIRDGAGSEHGEHLAELVADAGQLVNDLSSKVRNIITRLHPPVLFYYGLEAALRWYIDLLKKRTDFTISLVAERTVPRLSQDHELALFRITKEALNNAAKYSGAKHVTVTLGCSGGTVRLSVSDDGTGFDQSTVSPSAAGGWGLTIMRERMAMIGGTFHLETAPGAGATIYLEIPEESADAN